jgi:tetrahydromethanopterin S-methyltransferase subunit G
MFQDDIFDEWLDSESKTVLGKFKSNKPLSIEDKMILTLKAQTNHFAHLDQDIRKDIAKLGESTNKRFEQVDKRFEQVDKRFEQLNLEIKNIYQAINNQTWKMIGAIGLIVILGKIINDIPLFLK